MTLPAAGLCSCRSISAARPATNQLHVAAAVDHRDRRTDGRTDTVPLHRRSPLEADRVNNSVIVRMHMIPGLTCNIYVGSPYSPTKIYAVRVSCAAADEAYRTALLLLLYFAAATRCPWDRRTDRLTRHRSPRSSGGRFGRGSF